MTKKKHISNAKSSADTDTVGMDVSANFDLDLIWERFSPKNLQDCARVANYLCSGRKAQHLHSDLKHALFQRILEINISGSIGPETAVEEFFNHKNL